MQLVNQLQWLQKAETILKPDGSSSTTNTVRFLSDMLKEGTQLADNKCMCRLIFRHKFYVSMIIVYSDDRNL